MGVQKRVPNQKKRLEDVEIEEAVIKVEEAPVKEQQSLGQSMVFPKQELIDDEGVLILSNPIDSLPTDYVIKSNGVAL